MKSSKGFRLTTRGVDYLKSRDHIFIKDMPAEQSISELPPQSKNVPTKPEKPKVSKYQKK
jgi:hypothetical protein